MLWIVRVALQRPYTFIVMAVLILIMGVLSALKTPTDIFPEIRIPVIGVAWQYSGLSPDEMSGRMIYPYERAIPTLVDNVEHVESNSLPGMGVVWAALSALSGLLLLRRLSRSLSNSDTFSQERATAPPQSQGD